MPAFSFLRNNDNRSFKRYHAPIFARIRGDRQDYQRVTDIGRGGLRMSSKMMLRSGDSVPVWLRFPDLDEEIEVSGRVVWRRSGEFGLDYRDMNEEDSGFLELLVAHQEVLSRTVRN